MKLDELDKLRDSIQVVGEWTGKKILEFWITGGDYYPVIHLLSDTGIVVSLYERKGSINVFDDDEFQMEIPIESNEDMDILGIVCYLAELIKDKLIPSYTSCEWI